MTGGRRRLLSTEARLPRATGRARGRGTKVSGAEATTSHSATPNPDRDRRAAPPARMDPTEAATPPPHGRDPTPGAAGRPTRLQQKGKVKVRAR